MEKAKNREWVKTATIIFLAVLLVLTFFSNTIMNRTLPEVASQEVESGSITAKVRGTGKVSAVSNTEVKATATRYIAQINVKEGQEIEAGDVLFTMGAGDSEELATAQDNLDDLEYTLQKENVTIPYSSSSSSSTLINNLNVELQIAEQNLQNAIDAAYSTDAQFQAQKEALDSAESNLTSVETIQTVEQAHAASTYAEKYNNAKADYDKAEAAGDEEGMAKALDAMADAESEYQAAINNSEEEIAKAQRAVDAEQAKYDSMVSAASHNAAVADAESEVRAAQYALDTAIETANTANATASQNAAAAYIDMAATQNKIEKAEAKVAELSGEDPQEIVAQVSGTVTSISVNSGSKVSKDQVLCIIESDDKGYTMSFSITNDQAKRIKVGDTATISNYYWGSDITATVSSIQVDQSDPQSKKKVTVDLEGDVTSGAELTVSIGQKSATYDTVVPNSAVRSDSNGSFVLVLEAKNSPLGNRYYAKRVSVEVLASDDVNSAINGDLSTGDFVITTSSAPISSGDQVRMADTAQ